MIYAKIVIEGNKEHFQEALNQALDDIQKRHYGIRDIKFAMTSPTEHDYDMPFQALAACIIYEMRADSGYSGNLVL